MEILPDNLMRLLVRGGFEAGQLIAPDGSRARMNRQWRQAQRFQIAAQTVATQPDRGVASFLPLTRIEIERGSVDAGWGAGFQSTELKPQMMQSASKF
jgi:hypothetical protein